MQQRSWAGQIEQPTAAARWVSRGGVGVAVSGLGMRQLMAAWVLGSGVTAWAWATVSRRGRRRHSELK